MRSVAFQVAQEDFLCLWIKKSYGEISGGRFEAVVQTLSKAIRRKSTNVIFFLDDPWGSRVRPAEVLESLEDASFKWMLVLCARRTDAVVSGLDGTVSADISMRTLEISTDFSTGELDRLPEYLVSLRVAESIEKARAMMKIWELSSRSVIIYSFIERPDKDGA